MSVESGSLAPLVRMSPLPDGVALTHRLPADSVSLADLRAVAPLRAGHVVTVALAVAEALVDLDEQRLAHGGVSAAQVVVAPDGSVVLAGCGLAWRRPPGDTDGPSVVDDVADLGELVRDLLGAGSSPSSLVLAALRAADPDPGLRPTPLELIALLRRCGRADPLLDVIWGGTARQVHEVIVEPTGREAVSPADPAHVPTARTSAARLRVDPRTDPGPGAVTDPGDDADGSADGRERVDQLARAEATARPRTSAPRGPRAPRRPTTRERRRPRRRGGPWVIVLVSVLAALALGAVRVGARAMADGPAGGPGAVGITATGTTTTDLPTDGPTDDPAATPTAPGSADATSTDPTSTDTTRSAAAADADGSSADALEPGEGVAEGVVDLDRGAVSTATDWPALLAAADAGRQRALVAGDATELATWVDPKGSAWVADAALAARVTALGAQIEGGALVVLDVRARRVAASQAVLLVQDRRDAYTVRTAAGTSSVPARAPRWWQVTLRRTTDSDGAGVWRIRDVSAAQTPSR
jgi:hypothetical protein